MRNTLISVEFNFPTQVFKNFVLSFVLPKSHFPSDDTSPLAQALGCVVTAAAYSSAGLFSTQLDFL